MKMEEIKGQNYDTFGSLVSISMDNNKILRTILDVLIEMHLEGKTTKTKQAIEAYVKQRLVENLEISSELLMIAKNPEK